MKTKLSILAVVFSLVVLACSQLTINLGADQAQPSPTSPAVTVAPTKTVQAAANTEALLTETDACKLFDELKACQVLGEAVLPPAPANSPGYSVCPFFTSTGKGIYVAITIGDQARKNLLNEISQYQKGCSVSYSGGTSTATPFPPAVEALMSKPVLELYQMDIEMQAKCGGKIEPLPEFGPDAYAYLKPTGLQMGLVAIVSGDRIYSFSYADPKLDIPQMVEKAKEVVRAVFLPSPSGCPAPSSGEPNQSSAPTPVSSPTLAGPTPVSSPTLAGPTPVSSPTLAGPTPVSSPTLAGPTPVSSPTWVGPTPVGGPTWVGPTPVSGPTWVGPTPVTGPTWVGPTPIPYPTPIGGGPTAVH